MRRIWKSRTGCSWFKIVKKMDNETKLKGNYIFEKTDKNDARSTKFIFPRKIST